MSESEYTIVLDIGQMDRGFTHIGYDVDEESRVYQFNTPSVLLLVTPPRTHLHEFSGKLAVARVRTLYETDGSVRQVRAHLSPAPRQREGTPLSIWAAEFMLEG